MSAEPIAPPPAPGPLEQSYCVVHSSNPYADTPTSILLDTLEHHHDQTGTFIPELVFEMANRLIELEGLGIPEIRE